MHIPVTVFDILCAAHFLKIPPEEVYEHYYFLGILPHERYDPIAIASVKLRKPCGFLEAGRCLIYPARPIACMLFPEHQTVARTLNTLIDHDRSGEYLCLHRDIPVPAARAGVIKQLGRMMEREVIVSDLYLFGDSPFIIDFSDGKTGLRKMYGQESAGRERDRTSFSFSMLEDAFRNVFSAFPPFAETAGKIGRLESGDVKQELFRHLADGDRLRRFQQDREDHVFVIGRNNQGLVPKRKRLIPDECLYPW